MLNKHSTLINGGLDSVLEFSVYLSLTEFTLHIVDDRHNPVDFSVENFALLKTSQSNALLNILLFRTCLRFVVRQLGLDSFIVFWCCWKRTLKKVLTSEGCWLQSRRSGSDKNFLGDSDLVFFCWLQVWNGRRVFGFYSIRARWSIREHLSLKKRFPISFLFSANDILFLFKLAV